MESMPEGSALWRPAGAGGKDGSNAVMAELAALRKQVGADVSHALGPAPGCGARSRVGPTMGSAEGGKRLAGLVGCVSWAARREGGRGLRVCRHAQPTYALGCTLLLLPCRSRR
jgi:hypothetical protein